MVRMPWPFDRSWQEICLFFGVFSAHSHIHVSAIIMALMRSFLLVLCTGTLCVFTGADDPDVSVLEGDDACTDSEEGECSLSLRQLRLGRQQAQTEEAAGEGDGEPVSFALPCTEPSEFAAEYDSGSLENFSFAEINQHVQDSDGGHTALGVHTLVRDSAEESETADETGSDCFEHDVYYREANHAISMHGAHRTVQHSADACQSACAKPGCYEEELQAVSHSVGHRKFCCRRELSCAWG
eukprot:s4165_g6.t1